MSLTELLAVARGDRSAELLIRNARIINVFSGRIEENDIAIFDGRIAGIGSGYRGLQEVDVEGAYVAPGLIDAHVHIESSLCVPAQFAAAVLPHGVTCVVCDPHEVANVAGIDGVRAMIEMGRGLPLTVKVMAPSCVPATNLATTGAALTASELALLRDEPEVIGLAEVMSFPAVIEGDPMVLSKIDVFAGKPRDGHLPAVTGKRLSAYVATGIGSEHECMTPAEAEEKLARGLYILIREATNAHNLHALLPMVTVENSRRICFCTDDRIPADLIDQGSIDWMVREAIRYGIDPITAIRMATLNTVEWFGLTDRGAIAPGRVADFIVLDSLDDFSVRDVYCAGKLTARDGVLAPDVRLETPPLPDVLCSTVNCNWSTVDFRIPARGKTLRVIGSVEGQLVTRRLELRATLMDGEAIADPERDLLKMALIGRHRWCGSLARGFIQGFGFKRGAIAGTVAHDHHNLVVIGADDQSMETAARAVSHMGGGLVVAEGDVVVASLPLPVAGLMSDLPLGQVRSAYDLLRDAVRERGGRMHDPFMAMSFMALECIPSLKLTDLGLVDVERFEFVDLFVQP
jgi:adenine deaminase